MNLYSGGNRHIGNHAFRNVVTLSARQFAQQSQSEETAGNNQEGKQAHLAQAGSGKIKVFSQPPHGPAGKLCGDDRPDGYVKPAFFRAFTTGGTPRARREINHRCQHNRRRQRVIEFDEQIVDDPAAGEKVDGQRAGEADT